MRIEKDAEDIRVENMIRSGELFKLIPAEGVYSLNIKVTDPVAASEFFSEFFLTDKGEKELNEKCGFTIQSVNNFMAKDMSFVMDKLEQCMDYLSSRDVRKGIKL